MKGPDAETYLRRALPGRIPTGLGRVSLSPLVDENGNLAGDMTIMKAGDQLFRMFGSGGANRIQERLLRPCVEGLDVTMTNRTDDTAGFVIAGPTATALTLNLIGGDLPAFFRGMDTKISDIDCTVLRLSFVGEVSYEIHCTMPEQLTLHDAIIAANGGTAPAMFGSRALNALRIEKGFARTGEELNVEISPFEVGMGGLIDLKRSDFYAHEELTQLKNTPSRYRMVQLLIDSVGDDPSGGEPILAGDKLAGWVSSATWGHRLNQAVGIGFLFAGHDESMELETEILGKRCRITVLSGAAFDPSGERARA